MSNLKNIEKQTGQFILMVGDSGSGKTCAANSYPGSCYNFDFDRRIRGAAAYSPLQDKMATGEISYDYWLNDKTYSEVASKLDRIVTKAEARRSEFQNVILSSLTSMEAFMIADAWKWTSTTSQGGGDKVRVFGKENDKYRIKLPGWDQWGYEQVAFSEIIETMKLLSTLGVNCIIDAHWATRYDELGKADGMDISIRPKLGKNVLKDFDEIYFFKKRSVGGSKNLKVIHEVIFRNELARTGYPRMPNTLEWTGKNFYDCIQEYMVEENSDDTNNS